MEICFATSNANKLSEIQSQLGTAFTLLSLKDIGCTEEIEETENTIEGNSLLKAKYVFENYKIPCFADDTGLEINALNGAPGVHSARYAGEHRSNEDNINLVLTNLQGVSNRSARFKTVITLVGEQECVPLEGIVNGLITLERSGTTGFGYDPIFQPEGHTCTFAEMTTQEKNAISHRGIAVRKLVAYLKKKA